MKKNIIFLMLLCGAFIVTCSLETPVKPIPYKIKPFELTNFKVVHHDALDSLAKIVNDTIDISWATAEPETIAAYFLYRIMNDDITKKTLLRVEGTFDTTLKKFADEKGDTLVTTSVSMRTPAPLLGKDVLTTFLPDKPTNLKVGTYKITYYAQAVKLLGFTFTGTEANWKKIDVLTEYGFQGKESVRLDIEVIVEKISNKKVVANIKNLN